MPASLPSRGFFSSKIMPVIIIIAIIFAAVIAFILFWYLVCFSLVLGLIFYVIAWVQRIRLRKKPLGKTPPQSMQGQVYEHDDN